jgi:heme O synthase-like polyprenyltransferase
VFDNYIEKRKQLAGPKLLAMNIAGILCTLLLYVYNFFYLRKDSTSDIAVFIFLALFLRLHLQKEFKKNRYKNNRQKIFKLSALYLLPFFAIIVLIRLLNTLHIL